MSWLCSVCEKSFSRKDNMQRHVMSKHRNAGLTPFQTVPIFSQKCQRFRFEQVGTSYMIIIMYLNIPIIIALYL